MLSHEMKEQLERMLEADLGRVDLTSIVVPEKKARAKIVAREQCVVSGLEEAVFLLRLKHVNAIPKVREGQRVGKGAIVMSLNGMNRAIFNVERTALNVVSRMSAVATACAEARKAAGKKVVVAITRKTMPGFNLFDNKAAEAAGIWTHRINLNSFVLLKDNHLRFFGRASDAVLEARRYYGNSMPVEIEADSLKQAFEAMVANPDILMLDNFSPKEAKKAVRELRKKGFAGNIELSGGINMQNLRQYANAKPDIISMGSLTQAVQSKNFSLEML